MAREKNEPLIWFLISSTHIECSFAETLLTLKGQRPLWDHFNQHKVGPAETHKPFTVVIMTKDSKQAIAEFTDNEGKEVEGKLEASINSGEFKSATEESEGTTLSPLATTEIIHTK